MLKVAFAYRGGSMQPISARQDWNQVHHLDERGHNRWPNTHAADRVFNVNEQILATMRRLLWSAHAEQ